MTIHIIFNGRFPLLRILNTTTSMLFRRLMELSIKYPQSIMVVVFSKGNKGNRPFYTRKNAQLVTNLQQTCSKLVGTNLLQDLFALLVPSLLTSSYKSATDLLQA